MTLLPRLPFLKRNHALEKYRHGSKPFALVTGSSLGIGRALAIELADLGFNVILHARTIEELQPVEDAIKAKHAETEVVRIAQDSAEVVDWDQFTQQLEGLNITILINNVGTNSLPFNAFEIPPELDLERTIRVNAIFPTQITRRLLPTLIANGPSLILNMCSAVIYPAPPFLPVYSGTKGYNLNWSRSLYHELRLLNKPVDCKAVMTAAVSTDGNNVPVTSFVPTAQVYAKSMLARAGTSGSVYHGWWKHAFQTRGARFVNWCSPSLIETFANSVGHDLLVWREKLGDKTALPPNNLPKTTATG